MAEESEILQRGYDASQRAADWYKERMGNVKKRKSLSTIGGMVPLVSALICHC